MMHTTDLLKGLFIGAVIVAAILAIVYAAVLLV